MRGLAIVLLAVVGFVTVPVAGQAAPAAPREWSAGTAILMLVAGGCGRGYHAQRYRDYYGYWRTRCVPNRYY